MKCPFCKSSDTQVIDSRVSDDGDSIRRRRRCTSCNKRFTTYETIELRMPQVVKQDGSRTEFDLEKLRTGFMRALHKRPVPTQLVDDALATITQDVLALGERELPSRRLGEMVMRELKRLDQVAYIRFASVYRSFQGVDDFQDAIKEVQLPTPVKPQSKAFNAKDANDAKEDKGVDAKNTENSK
jgi:transcriptional repressor NrdR